MSIESIKMVGIDCCTPLTLPTATEIAKAGFGFVGRYIVPSSFKRLTPQEVKILTSLKLLILSVFETTAGRAKGGAPNGIVDGKAAYNEAKLLGMPSTACIYFAVDYDAGTSGYNAIEEYLEAARTQIGEYKIGVYGSYGVIEAMYKRGVCDCYWQKYAWSDGKLSEHTNVYQYDNDRTFAGIGVDLNKSYGREGFWNLNKVSSESWEEILSKVSSNASEWNSAIKLAMKTTRESNDEKITSFQNFGTLIEKVRYLKYSTPLTWTEILSKVSNNSAEWERTINNAVSLAAENSDLGPLEIFKYLPNLIVKIYEYDKKVS